MKPNVLRVIVENHEAYWKNMQPELLRYKNTYEGNFWDHGQDVDDTQIKIQTNDGYSTIESYQASLFAKNPAVVLKTGIRDKGKVKIAEPIANAFFVRARKQIKDTSRLALIYPNGYLKLVPMESEHIYEKLVPIALPAWEVIVDVESPRWDMQRYIGHIYWMPVTEAKEKFGNKQFNAQCREFYFEQEDSYKAVEDSPERKQAMMDPAFQYIKVVEMYDFEAKKLYFWSPNYQSGQKFLDENVLPFSDLDGTHFAPIGPFLYTSLPDYPLLGYSAMKRSYDQIYEINIIRSFQANAVRKASRQWLVKKDRLDEDQMNQATAGIDGLWLEVETEGNEKLSDIIHPVPHARIPAEVEAYHNEVKKDKDSGTNLAPFTRGEATKASATEVAAMAAYTSSEVGMLARERDAAIEYLAYLYLNMLAMYIEDEQKPILLKINNELVTVSADDLRGDYEIYASDSAATPLSELFQKQEFLSNIDLLQKLGIPAALIREEVLKRLNLPADWNDAAVEAEKAALKAQVEMPPQTPSVMDLVGNPSVKNVSQVLPNVGEGYTPV